MNLEQLKSNSFVPYSGQPAACVVKSVEGNYFPGVRIENISFPLTISATQNALFTCLSEGERPKAIYLENTGTNDLKFWKHEYNVWVHQLKELQGISFKPVHLTARQSTIKNTLHSLLDHAVTRHSNFPVSALLQTGQGFISGVNIECSEWSFGLCAERMAIAKALSYGFSNLEALYIHARDGEYSSPCGACRQVILEHLPRNPVYLYHANGTRSMHFSSDLLPHSFQSSTLKKNSE